MAFLLDKRVHPKVTSIHMRTNIEIDDALMREAMRRSGATTKKTVVEQALRLLVQTHTQASFRKLRGKVKWQGDLSKSRISRNPGY